MNDSLVHIGFGPLVHLLDVIADGRATWYYYLVLTIVDEFFEFR